MEKRVRSKNESNLKNSWVKYDMSGRLRGRFKIESRRPPSAAPPKGCKQYHIRDLGSSIKLCPEKGRDIKAIIDGQSREHLPTAIFPLSRTGCRGKGGGLLSLHRNQET